MIRVLLIVFMMLASAPFANAVDESPRLAMPPTHLPEAPPSAPWAKPLADGPLRALIIAPEEAQRDVTGFLERCDAMSAVFILPAGGADETIQTEMIEALDEKLDVVITSGGALGRAAEPVIIRLIERIREGTGLLLVLHGDMLSGSLAAALEEAQPLDETPRITRGLGDALAPEWLDGFGFTHPSQLGEGRLAVLDYIENPPGSHFLFPTFRSPILASDELFDTYWALPIRAALWASKHAPALAISSVTAISEAGPEESDLPADLPREALDSLINTPLTQWLRRFMVQLDSPAPKGYMVDCQLRQRGGNWMQHIEERGVIRKGDDAFAVSFVAGPGVFFLDVWLRDGKGRVVDWFSQPITISGWPQFRQWSISKTSVQANDAIDIDVNMALPAGINLPTTLMARAVDPMNRRIAETSTTVRPDSGPVRLRLELADVMSQSLRIEILGVCKGMNTTPTEWEMTTGANASAYVSVRNPINQKRFSVVARAGDATEYNARLRNAQLAFHGVDTMYIPPSEGAGLFLTRANLRPIYEIASYAPEGVLDGVVRQPSLTDIVYRENEAKRLNAVTRGLWAGENALLSLGDGACLAANGANVCQSATNLDLYRKHLEKSYVDLLSINAAWSTQFNLWGEVTPPPEQAVRQFQTYAPWLAFRDFMRREFTGFIHLARTQIAAPGARTGFVARMDTDPYVGYDWPVLLSGLGMAAVPRDEMMQARIKAYARPGAFTGLCLWREAAWLSGERAEAFARWAPWRAALDGFTSAWWGDSPADGVQALTPDGACTPPFAAFTQAARDIKDGPGAVLHASERVDQEIRLLDSLASRTLSYVLPEESPNTAASELAFLETFGTLGSQPKLITPEAFHDNRDDRRGKMLLMPATHILDDADVAAIGRFVIEGGTVVADVMPGFYDEQGVPRPVSPLAQVFASEQTPEWAAKAGWRLFNYENGRAILTGAMTPSADEAANPARLDALAALRELAGLESLPHIAGRGDSPFPGLCMSFTYGQARIAAVLCDPGAPESGAKGKLLWPDAGQVYDLMNGGPVMGAKNIRLRLEAGEPALFASLPYRVDGVGVTTPKFAVCGSRLEIELAVRVSRGTPGRHLIQLDMSPMGGAPIACYSRQVDCPDGQASVFIPLAINEAALHGVKMYILHARDLLSGVSGQAIVELSPRL